jgi:hypothetical protein
MSKTYSSTFLQRWNRIVAIIFIVDAALGFICSPATRPLGTRHHTKQFPFQAIQEKERLKEEQKPILNDLHGVNGDDKHAHNGEVDSMADAKVAVEELTKFIDEINQKVSNGTASLLKNITEGIDDKLVGLPETTSDELSSYLVNLVDDIQKAQKLELERKLAEMDRRFLRPLEDLAFSDAPLFAQDIQTENNIPEQRYKDPRTVQRKELVLMGENSTLVESTSKSTRELLRNFNVAPFYYSIALLVRWARKASYPHLYLLRVYRYLGSIIKSNSKGQEKSDFTGENLQAGWKRTGEIAAKGPMARRWAVLRRSAEIWAYFSSFYLKDRRITSKYNSGQWSEERFKAERSKLGAEITQK